MKHGKVMDLSQLREHVWLVYSVVHAHSDSHTKKEVHPVALKVPHNHCSNDRYMCVHQMRMMMVFLKYLSLKRCL